MTIDIVSFPLADSHNGCLSILNWVSVVSSSENESMEINCAEVCVNGCVMGDQCPNQEYKDQASKFIHETSLDTMLAMAEEAVRKKMMERNSEPPKWILPED